MDSLGQAVRDRTLQFDVDLTDIPTPTGAVQVLAGETRYWHFRHIDNAIWSYPDPLEGVAAIRGRVAFDIASGFRIERGEL